MSIPVELSELADTLERYPWGYFVTVGGAGRAHSLAVPTDFRDGVLHLCAGRSTIANVSARPEVTMVFPPSESGGYSLILDGVAEAAAEGNPVTFTPTYAVLHRPAIG